MDNAQQMNMNEQREVIQVDFVVWYGQYDHDVQLTSLFVSRSRVG
jgi:hypothetical protein